MRKTKCCICGKEIAQHVYPNTPNGTGGKPYKIQICGSKSCQMRAWSKLRRKFGVTEKNGRSKE